MKKAITLLLFCGLTFIGTAQNYTLFYNFDNVNQNLMVNPSNPHDFRYVIGIPALSGFSVHVNNSAFKLGDYFNDNTNAENLKNIISNLDEGERINLYENLNVIYAGFGVKHGYVSFGVQQESTLNMLLPGKFLNFLYYGNQDENSSVNITSADFNAEATIQMNYHIGYQHYLIDSTLILGGRFKYITGAGNGHFKNIDASITSDIFEWKVNTDITIETSGYDYIDNYESYSPMDYFTSGNNGYSVDLGATYFLKKFKISASVLNMGSITWKVSPKNYQSNGEFIWDGALIDDSNQDIDFDAVLDTLENQLGFIELSPYSYKTKLPMHILASAEYSITPKHAFAVTYQGTNWKGNMFNTVGANYIGRWSKRFNLLLGYSRTHDGLNNFGAGISGALGPLQLYLMTNNAWGLTKLTELQSTSVRFGINLVFYDKHLLKKNRIKNQTTKE